MDHENTLVHINHIHLSWYDLVVRLLDLYIQTSPPIERTYLTSRVKFPHLEVAPFIALAFRLLNRPIFMNNSLLLVRVKSQY